MLKYNSLRGGGGARTFPRNCQKTTLESTEMSAFGLSLADEGATCFILPHCLLQSICRSVTSRPFIHTRLWHQGTQQCPVWCGCRNNGQVTCLCTQAFSTRIEALPLCCQQCLCLQTFDLRYTLDIPRLHLVYITYEGPSGSWRWWWAFL